jgi:hypothetical protein
MLSLGKSKPKPRKSTDLRYGLLAQRVIMQTLLLPVTFLPTHTPYRRHHVRKANSHVI